METSTIIHALMVFPGDLPLIAAAVVLVYSCYEYFWALQSAGTVLSSLLRRLGYVLGLAIALLLIRIASVTLGLGLAIVIFG